MVTHHQCSKRQLLRHVCNRRLRSLHQPVLVYCRSGLKLNSILFQTAALCLYNLYNQSVIRRQTFVEDCREIMTNCFTALYKRPKTVYNQTYVEWTEEISKWRPPKPPLYVPHFPLWPLPPVKRFRPMPQPEVGVSK